MTCVKYGIQKAFAGRLRPACQCLDHAILPHQTQHRLMDIVKYELSLLFTSDT